MAKPKPPSLASIEVGSTVSQGLVRLERVFEVATPMFGGGVYVDPDELRRQKKAPDPVTPIRAASIRGQLRFWWRSCSGETSLSDLWGAEADLWGAASRPGRVRVSLVGAQPAAKPVEVFDLVQARSGKWNPRPKTGMQDVAYGAFPLQPKGSQPQRVEPGRLTRLAGSVTVVVEGPADREKELARTLDAWLTFGGLGGRTRRGFGAVVSRRPKDPEQLLAEIQARAHALPGVPSLAGACLRTRPGDPSAEQVFAQGLRTLRSMRQGVDLGRNPGQAANRPGRSRWPEAEQIRDDPGPADWEHKEKLVAVEAFPRAAFGMPIIFQFQSRNDPANTTLVPEGRERRASPLIIRPYRDPSGGYRGLALVLTDETLRSEQVTLKHQSGVRPVRHLLTAAEARWRNSPLRGQPDVLQAFLDYFAR